eukprot:TRINITY_DN2317_c0_g5_i1.p1 TRINITY_DN2317_c0_g5~~TRINITY_DN2317_c0_g5_i1.p1  ORF type:complete len:188 (-),score=26.36 TRINITY_DN2317_c0_g5_i1:828-1391(-)
MKIEVNIFGKWFSIEVLPTDTVWTLKWKVYENEYIRDYSHRLWRNLPPSPDDQELWTQNKEMRNVLEECERSMESYSICENSFVVCWKKKEHSCCAQSVFCGFLDTFRKKKTMNHVKKENAVDLHLQLTWITPLSWIHHGSIHIHEVRSIRLEPERCKLYSIPSSSCLHYETYCHLCVVICTITNET